MCGAKGPVASLGAFKPSMSAERRGVAVLGAPLAHASRSGLVEIWRARCEAGASGRYVSRHPRLFVIIRPMDWEMALDGGRVRAASRLPSASYVPAEAPLDMTVAGETEVHHLDLHFDLEQMGPIDGLTPEAAGTPRLMFESARIQRFARLMASACRGADGPLGLYGDGLATAIVAAAFAGGPDSRRSPLSDAQLRLATDYIEERCARPIRLQELASLSGLSESYFSHAFKAATGVPPHRWQLEARVRRAKAMIAKGEASLSEIAGAVGFADQAHFSRVFRALAGVSPSAWRAAAR